MFFSDGTVPIHELGRRGPADFPPRIAPAQRARLWLARTGRAARTRGGWSSGAFRATGKKRDPAFYGWRRFASGQFRSETAAAGGAWEAVQAEDRSDAI